MAMPIDPSQQMPGPLLPAPPMEGAPPAPGGMFPPSMPPAPGPAGLTGMPMPTSPPAGPVLPPMEPEPPKKPKFPEPEPGSLMADILDIRKKGREEGNVQREKLLAKRYPRPEQADIMGAKSRLEEQWVKFRQNAEFIRHYRFHEDATPMKWQMDLSDGRRAWMNLSNDEILWCVANATRNPPIVTVPPTSPHGSDRERADKQERWLNALLVALEKQEVFYHPAVDQQHECGLGGFLFFFNDAYDQIDFDYREYGKVEMPEDEEARYAIEWEMTERNIGFEESRDGKHWILKETPAEFNKRTAAEIEAAGLPFGVRQVDMTSTYFEKDGKDLTVAVISERKAWPVLRPSLVEKLGEDELIPPPGQRGSPEYGGWHFDGDTVECITYYDRRWYAYIVGGRLIELKEHHLPRIPLFVLYGNVTSAPEMHHRYQGVVHGMQHMEQFANDAWSLALDNAMRYSRMKPVLEDPNPQILSMMDESIRNSMKIDLTGDDNELSIVPGHLASPLEHIQPNPLLSQLLQQSTQGFQASGLNPVSKGTSPGADMAGYSLNMLQSTGIGKYQTFLDNDQRALSEFYDFVRLVIRDVLQERVYLVTEQRSGSDTEAQVLGLGPGDIGDTLMPSTVLIDWRSEPNRAAYQQIMMAAQGGGFIPWEVVARDAFKAKDPALWRAMILEDFALEQVLKPAYMENMKQLIAGTPPQDMMAAMQQQMGSGPMPGMPPPGGGPQGAAQSLGGLVQQAGGQPAPPPF